MTPEERQLLFKDLCGRLPYGVFIHYHWSHEGKTIDEDRELDFSDVETLKYNIENPQNDWCEISWKPYLRPMSSMTDSEKEELKQYLGAEELDCGGFGYIEGGTLENYASNVPYSICSYVIDWLLSHHFDYHGLIEKGLALGATEGMYKF